MKLPDYVIDFVAVQRLSNWSRIVGDAGEILLNLRTSQLRIFDNLGALATKELRTGEQVAVLR